MTKVKSLIFWTLFFFFILSTGLCSALLLVHDEHTYYLLGGDNLDLLLSMLGYFCGAIYIIFTILIATNRLPKRIEKFEKNKYLLALFVILFIEFMIISANIYDF